ncbi:unnamed protein product [Anisakis simplex]|uniref:Rhodanese domain-containing protein n=1 Tax=Anisakis simplex TaxID=6269 RepID=A0A0M3JVM2_ANISI|nr:unnamed protein product [Anisakis simplex]
MPNLSIMAHELDSTTLANLVRTVDPLKKPLIVDCRCFLDYNLSHIRSAVNAFYSKMMRRRLFDNKISSSVMLSQLGHHHALHENNHHEVVSTSKNESDEQKQPKQSNATALLDLVLYCERDDIQQPSNTTLYPFGNLVCNSNNNGSKIKRKLFGSFGSSNSTNLNNSGHFSSIDFLRILQQRLTQSKSFNRVWILQGGR